MKNALAIIALVFIVGTLFSGNFGFAPLNGAESLGYNTLAVFVYVGGSWLIYRALKREQKKP